MNTPRNSVPVDVLAQLQLCHHGSRRWPAPHSPEHLLLSGSLHSGHLWFVLPDGSRWQAGHGEIAMKGQQKLNRTIVQFNGDTVWATVLQKNKIKHLWPLICYHSVDRMITVCLKRRSPEAIGVSVVSELSVQSWYYIPALMNIKHEKNKQRVWTCLTLQRVIIIS